MRKWAGFDFGEVLGKLLYILEYIRFPWYFPEISDQFQSTNQWIIRAKNHSNIWIFWFLKAQTIIHFQINRWKEQARRAPKRMPRDPTGRTSIQRITFHSANKKLNAAVERSKEETSWKTKEPVACAINAKIKASKASMEETASQKQSISARNAANSKE